MEQVETRLFVAGAVLEGLPQGFERPLVWCRLEGMRSLKAAVRLAARGHVKAFGVAPVYGFVRQLPRGVENGVETALTPSPALPQMRGERANLGEGVDDDGVFVFEAEWMPVGLVAVGVGTPLPAGTQASPQMREGRANLGGGEL